MIAHRTLLDSMFHWERATPDRLFLTQPMGGGLIGPGTLRLDNVMREVERMTSYAKKNSPLRLRSLEEALAVARRTGSYLKSLDFPKTWSFKEAMDEARRMAAYLRSLELPARSQIALCSKNCAYWMLADLAIWMAGHVTVPVYPTLTTDTVAHILRHSEAKLLFVGKLDPVWDEMKQGVPEGLPLVAFPLAPENDYDKWDDIVRSHEPLQAPVTRQPEELATIVYTSGSTGVPKGVMLSFGAMLKSVEGIAGLIHATQDDRMLSYLPLSHVMERWIGECHAFYSGFQVFFAESLATFLRDLQRARPTLFVSVPRLWMKFQAGVFQKIPPARVQKLMRIPVLNKVVKKKILAGLGLDRVRLAGSGSAPIPAEVIQWYLDLGLELLEAYGMTENFCYSHINKPGQIRAGYVGSVHEGVEDRLDENGEILVKSPCNMMGYYKQDALTREAFTPDGFLLTGDQGELDSLKRLRITGRVKDLFKTSKGKYVAPAPIENKILGHPFIELCCVCGSGYPQPHALIMLSEAARNKAKQGQKAELEKELSAHLMQLNRDLDTFERIEFFSVVQEEWMTENGFLTPTLKVKRAKLEKTYRPFNEQWYALKKPVIWA